MPHSNHSQNLYLHGEEVIAYSKYEKIIQACLKSDVTVLGSDLLNH